MGHALSDDRDLSFQAARQQGSPPLPCPRPSHTSSPRIYLGVRLIPKGIEDFLDGHDLAGPPIHCLPHNAVGLWARWSACWAQGRPPVQPSPAQQAALRLLPALAPGREGVVRGYGSGQGPRSHGPLCLLQDPHPRVFQKRVMRSMAPGRRIRVEQRPVWGTSPLSHPASSLSANPVGTTFTIHQNLTSHYHLCCPSWSGSLVSPLSPVWITTLTS